MNYKISGAIRRTRKYYIIFAILWVFISIVLVMPLTIGFHEAQIQHNISKGFEVIIDSIQHLGKSFGILSSQKIWGDYLKNVGLLIRLLSIVVFIVEYFLLVSFSLELLFKVFSIFGKFLAPRIIGFTLS